MLCSRTGASASAPSTSPCSLSTAAPHPSALYRVAAQMLDQLALCRLLGGRPVAAIAVDARSTLERSAAATPMKSCLVHDAHAGDRSRGRQVDRAECRTVRRRAQHAAMEHARACQVRRKPVRAGDKRTRCGASGWMSAVAPPRGRRERHLERRLARPAAGRGRARRSRPPRASPRI